VSIKRASTSTALNGFPKYPSMWDQSTAAATFDCLGTYTVGTTPIDYFSFGGIPQTYSHLQIRGLTKTTRDYSGNTVDWLYVALNSEGGNHNNGRQLVGNGSSVTADSSLSAGWLGSTISSSSFVSGGQYLFNPVVIDIFDYSSTSKYKTLINFTGLDTNSSSYPYNSIVGYASNIYKQLTPVTNISFSCFVAWAPGTTLSLYGIK